LGGEGLTELVVLVNGLLLADLEPLGSGGSEIVGVVGHCLDRVGYGLEVNRGELGVGWMDKVEKLHNVRNVRERKREINAESGEKLRSKRLGCGGVERRWERGEAIRILMHVRLILHGYIGILYVYWTFSILVLFLYMDKAREIHQYCIPMYDLGPNAGYIVGLQEIMQLKRYGHVDSGTVMSYR
jgi:hypothetical protein